MSADTIFGLIAAAAAGTCFDVAVVLYSLEARSIPMEVGPHPALLGRLLRRPRWIAAGTLDVLGWPLQLVALSLAPLTLVQPALALGLLPLLILGARVLGERVRAQEIAATASVVAGVVAIALAAPRHTTSHTSGPGIVVALVLLGLIALAPYVRRERVRPGLLVLGAGCAYAWTGLSSRLIADELSGGTALVVVGLGAATALVAMAGLLSETNALQRRPATTVAPAIYGIQTAVPVALAPLVVNERWGDTPLGGSVIVAGLVLVVLGAVALGRSSTVAEMVHPDPVAPPVTPEPEPVPRP